MAKARRNNKPTRKQLFLAALAVAGMTQESWAEQEGISYQHVYMVLRGARESQSLLARIDAFTEEQLAAATRVA